MYICEEEKMSMHVKRRRCLVPGREEVSCKPLTKLNPETAVEKSWRCCVEDGRLNTSRGNRLFLGV